jgi:SAM-dependent methyltransferase
MSHFEGVISRAARFCYRFATDPAHRSVALIRWSKPENLFQPHIDTAFDRYPELFAFAQRELSDSPDLRLLSFGCSTGEEVFTLRRYFPSAQVRGLDINPRNIAVCVRQLQRSPDPALSFAVAGATTAEPAESYDAIFALAVLRHGRLGRPGVERCDPLLRFADFEATVSDFARCLKSGGFLFINHSNFRFADIAVAARFEVALRQPPPSSALTPIFDRDNQLIGGAIFDEVAFRKFR